MSWVRRLISGCWLANSTLYDVAVDRRLNGFGFEFDESLELFLLAAFSLPFRPAQKAATTAISHSQVLREN